LCSIYLTPRLMLALMPTPTPCLPSLREEVIQAESWTVKPFRLKSEPFSPPGKTPSIESGLSFSSDKSAIDRRVMDRTTSLVRYERVVRTKRSRTGCLPVEE
jgi:hypothetical protein